MNHDDNKPDLRSWMDPALEARVVAWVVGEAAAFEVAELERLIAAMPELAVFKRRIEAVQGLVGEAVRPVGLPLRLAPERRAKLLAVIGEGGAASAAVRSGAAARATAFNARTARSGNPGGGWRTWVMPMAACVTVGLLLAAVMIPGFQKTERPRANETKLSAQRQLEPSSLLDSPAGDERRAVATGVVPDDMNVVFDMTAAASPVVSAPTAPAPLAAPAGAFQRQAPLPVQEQSELASMDRDQAFGDTASNGVLFGNERSGSARSAGLAKDKKQLSDNRLDGREFAAGAGGKANASSRVLSEQAGMPPEESAQSAACAEGAMGGARLAVQLGRISDVRPVKAESSSASEASDRFAPPEPDELSAVYGEVRRRPETKLLTEYASALAEGEVLVADAMAQAAAEQAPARRDVQPPVDESLRAEVSAANEAVSTFSLHVSDASYRLARAALARGEAPDAATIRPEEFYNAFDYGDPAPAAGEAVAGRMEQAAHPFLQQRNLVRVALRVPAVGRGAGTPLRLTVLLDTSGSMEREDRAATVRAALTALAGLLGPEDRVTLVGFARQPRLLVDNLAGDQAWKLVELAANTPAAGGTNLEEALRLAGDLARRHSLAGAQNRIVLLTDGAANLGDADPARLMAQVEELRRKGVAFDACGVGADGLDDTVLESLTRKGDGRYQVLNSPEEADAGFARKLAGAFRPAAENVKVQVRFNPARVGRYRLIGFEKHRLREEDFRNDKVDAAELAAEEAAVALYQVEVLPGGEGELGDVAVRFRDVARGEMVERTWTLGYVAQPAAFNKATPSLRLAGSAALLAENLRGGAVGGQIRLKELTSVVAGLRGDYAGDARVADFVTMFAHALRLSGE